jgi:prolipoprotein diacylglyceryltransferase
MYLLDAHPILVSSGGFTAYTHGFFFALAAFFATVILMKQGKKLGTDPLRVLENCVYIFLAGLFGARLGYLLIYNDQWVSVAQLWQIWQGGLVSYTGIVAGLGVGWLFVRKLPSEKRLLWADALVKAGLAAWAIGRLGNYYAADSFGVTSPVWSAFYGRVPIQLFESLLCLVVALKLSWMPKLRPGQQAYLGSIAYFAGRLLIDTWRDEGSLLHLHVSQWSSLILLAITIWLYRRFLMKKL